MKQLITFILAFCAFLTVSSAQTARVQVIHNSPEPTVDIYLNGFKALDDFEFRKATPFLDLPAGVPVSIDVAPASSTSVADAIANFNTTFEVGKTYVVTASGVVGSTTTPFTLITDGNAQETAPAGKVRLSILHGSPDAPAVDVVVRNGGTIVSNLSYGNFTPYVEVPAGDYFVDIKPAGSSTIVATYRADLTGLGGKAGKIMASGYLGGTLPVFGLYAIWANGQVDALPVSPVCRIQMIHNSPGVTVDIYKNGNKIYDDFEYRTAQPFTYVPAIFFNVGIAPANSTSVNDTIINIPATFENGKTYVIVASGIVGSTTTPFTLVVNDMGREAAVDTNKVDIAIMHGGTNAPAIDVDAIFVANNVATNLSYGNFTPYLSLAPDKYDFAIRPTGIPTQVASFRADISGLKGKSAYVFASGLIGGTPSFGLFAALADGTVLTLGSTPYSSVQIIHNSPEPVVDIYAGNTLLLNDFAFRTATPYVDVPANRNINIGVAPGNSSSVADAIATVTLDFNSTKRYTAFANGIVGNVTTPFTLLADDKALDATAPGFTAVSVLHGAPGAPAVDIVDRESGTVIAANLTYGTLNDYIQLPSDIYYIDVKPAGSDDIVATYLADLEGLDGAAIRVFASGILGGTPGFGLFAALTDGTVVALPAFPVARLQVIHNSPSPTVDVYAFDEILVDDFEFRTATEFFTVPAGISIPIGIAPASSSSVNDVIATFPFTFENGKTYVAVASGILGNATTPFTIFATNKGREEADDAGSVEFAILHGAPDAPPVNLVSYPDGTTLLSDLQYGEFTDYLPFDPSVLLLDIVPTASPNTIVGTYGGDLEDADGLSAIVFASGLLNGDPGFELWLALPNGFTAPFPSFARGQVIHNSPEPTVDAYYVDADTPEGIQLLDNLEFRSATGFSLYPADGPFSIAIAPENSSTALDAIYTQEFDLKTGKSYVIMAGGIVGSATTPFQLYINENGRFRGVGATNVDIALAHGSPDAPEVDVTLFNGPVLFDNIEFGEFSDYISVPPSTYQISVTLANDNTQVVRSYQAPIGALAGEAITVFASGSLTASPGFAVWVALADGTTFPLQIFSSTNELDEKLQGLKIAPNPVSDALQLHFELKDQEALRYGVRDVTGRMVLEGTFGEVNAGAFSDLINVASLNSGMYQLEITSDAGVQTTKFAIQR